MFSFISCCGVLVFGKNISTNLSSISLINCSISFINFSFSLFLIHNPISGPLISDGTSFPPTDKLKFTNFFISVPINLPNLRIWSSDKDVFSCSFLNTTTSSGLKCCNDTKNTILFFSSLE